MSPSLIELHETMFNLYLHRWNKQQFKNIHERSWVKYHMDFHYEWMCRLVPFSDFLAHSNLIELQLNPSTI
jgi:hypothetical protein